MFRLILGFTLACLTAQAQDARLRGTVTDPTGAVVSQARITIRNLDKGWTRIALTDEAGNYVVPQLPPNSYSVTAQAAGFKLSERAGIELQVDQEARLDLPLTLGDSREIVQVTESASLVQSENASTGAVVGHQKIVELPLNGREFWDLAKVAPMVFNSNQGATLAPRGGCNVAGNPETSNQFIMDGVDNNDQTTGQPTHRPSVDGIREFKVLTGVYAAEYGRQSGGQVIITTMSGGNAFHGTGYYFHRNDNLDARNFFLSGATPELKRHQYGGSNGGRIVRDRTFYFVTYEALTLGEGVARLRTVPPRECVPAILARSAGQSAIL